MTGSSKFRSLAIALGALFVVVACGGGGGGTGETLAADQTFRFGMSNDITSLDPAHVDSAVDITYLNEVFTGLYRFDNSLKIVPSGAASMPTISADGLTWTFALRHDVVFSNGDKVTSADWVWSWTRTLRLNDAYASNLEAIHGATDVENGAATITGLSAPDAPAGYWLTQLAMPTASEVLDKKVIDAAGDEHWTEQASTYIGSGPFKMTARTPKQSMDFAPVKNWWGGDTGKLSAIHVDIGIDDVSRVKKFESGGYENVGMANQAPGPDDVLRYKNDPINAKFDANAAKALYEKWDPNHTKVKGLEYRYNTSGGNTKRAENLQAQWKANLGVDVKLVPSDFPTLQRDRKKKVVIIGRESWGIDYDHPQDWFDNLFSCSQAKVGRGNDEAYCNPAMDAITTAANAKSINDPATVNDYVNAGKMLVNDVVWATIDYGTQPYLTQSYVRGMGYNGLYDFNWEGIRLLQH